MKFGAVLLIPQTCRNLRHVMVPSATKQLLSRIIGVPLGQAVPNGTEPAFEPGKAFFPPTGGILLHVP